MMKAKIGARQTRFFSLISKSSKSAQPLPSFVSKSRILPTPLTIFFICEQSVLSHCRHFLFNPNSWNSLHTKFWSKRDKLFECASNTCVKEEKKLKNTLLPTKYILKYPENINFVAVYFKSQWLLIWKVIKLNIVKIKYKQH